MTREERLIAYVDGQLDDRAAFEAEMAADPALAAEVARHQAVAGRIGQAFAPVLDEPVPPGLMATASAANDRGPRFGLPQWAAMAACLVVGVAAGRSVLPETSPLTAKGGVLVVKNDIGRALDRQLAADPGVVKVGVSFRRADGRYCRTFQSAPDRLAGLACRDGGRWVAEIASAWTPARTGGYRTAGSDTPPEVLAAMDRLIAGDPLDAAAERAARDRGWR